MLLACASSPSVSKALGGAPRRCRPPPVQSARRSRTLLPVTASHDVSDPF